MIFLTICAIIEFVCCLALFNITCGQRKEIDSLKNEAEAYKITAEELQRLYDEYKK